MARSTSILALGWATVELDRAADEFASLLVPGTSFLPGQPSVHLGARCRIGRVASMHEGELAPTVILLEASTEGRLAATLARHGEGWCVTWVSATAGTIGATANPDDADLPGTGPLVSALRPGPLGPERLVLRGPIGGPHRLIVSTVTIGP